MRAVRAVVPPGYASRQPFPVIVSPYKGPEESIYMRTICPDVQTANSAGKWLQIDKKSIKKNGELGSGAFGKVYKGVWTCTHQGKAFPIPVAIKSIIDRNEPGYDKAIEDIRAEADHLATLNNDNDPASHHIIKLYGMCHDDGVYQIVEEFAQHGQLDRYIHLTKVG